MRAQKVICKGLEGKVTGNTPIPIYNNRQGMTERLCTNQQEQQQERYKVYDDSNRLLSPSGALGSTDVAATATWPNTKCNLSKGSQRKME